jgi:hypothetical protein
LFSRYPISGTDIRFNRFQYQLVFRSIFEIYHTCISLPAKRPKLHPGIEWRLGKPSLPVAETPQAHPARSAKGALGQAAAGLFFHQLLPLGAATANPAAHGG